MALVYVQGAELGAAVQGGDVLAGVEQAFGIERGLDRMEQGDFVGVELGAHLVDLFTPDAMLAGDAATDRHAQLGILPPMASARSSSPGRLASNRISGCMLPSPAWNTLATRSPYSRDSSAMP